MVLTKLVSVENNSRQPLHLHNGECAADDRPLMLGRTHLFGQNDEGVDIPVWRAADPDHSALTIQAPDGRMASLCIRKGRFYRVHTPGGAHGPTFVALGGTALPNGRSKRLTIDADLQFEISDASLPRMYTPALCGVENGLADALRFFDLGQPHGNAPFIPAGRLTTLADDTGVPIPECKDKAAWNARRLVVKGGPGFEVSLYRIGHDIYYSTHLNFPRVHRPVPGGHSQGDHRKKFLVILNESDVRLLDAPIGLGDSHTWANLPVADRPTLRVHVAVELMRDIRRGTHGGLVESPVYVSRVDLRDADGVPLAGLAVDITANIPADVEVNGVTTKLGSATTTIQADPRGIVAIACAVATLGTPSFRLTFRDPATKALRAIDVHPGDRVAARLGSIQTGTDWARQRTASGRPLELPALDAATRTGAARVLHELVRCFYDPNADAPRPSHASVTRMAVTGHAVTRPHDHPLARTIDVSHLADGHCRGFEIARGRARMLPGTEARTALAAARRRRPPRLARVAAQDEGGWPTITSWFSGLWERAKRFFFEVTGKVVRFVIDVAGKLIELVVDAAEKLLQALTWFLKKVFGLDMDKLVDWLGFVFDWEAIRRTHLALRTVVTLGLADIETRIEAGRLTLQRIFADLRASFAREDAASQAARVHAVLPELLGPPPRQLVARHDTTAMDAPPMHWAQDALLHRGDLPTTFIDAATQIPWTASQTLVEPPGLPDTLKRLPDELTAILRKISDNLATTSFSEIITQIAIYLRDAAVDALEAALDAVFDLIRPVFGALRTLLTALLEIPVLSHVHTKYIDPGSPSSILDLCCLLIAMPATIALKLVLGRAPFDPSAEQACTTARTLDDLIAGLRSGAPPRSPRRLASRLALTESAIDLQFAWSFIGATTQVLSGCIYGAVDVCRVAKNIEKGALGYDLADLGDVINVMLGVKLGVDMAGYLSSYVVTSMYWRQASQDFTVPLSDRKRMDLALAYGQLFFRIKDVLRLTCWKQKPRWCGAMESIGGIGTLALVIAIVALQAQEAPGQASPPLTDAQASNVLGTKAGQGFALALNQLLAFPRELAALATQEAVRAAKASAGANAVVDLGALTEVFVEVLVGASRTFLQALAVPALGYTRAGLGYSYTRAFVPYS